MKKILFFSALLLTFCNNTKAQTLDFGVNVGIADYPVVASGLYAAGNFVMATKNIAFSFGMDVHTMKAAYYDNSKGPLSGTFPFTATAVVPHIAVLPKINLKRSHLYIGPVAGIIMIDYDFPGNSKPPLKDISTFMLGGQLGAAIYITKKLYWNIDLSPRMLKGRNENLALYPDRYLTLSTGIRIRL